MNDVDILDLPANVAYQEINIPVDFPVKLRKYIPNIEAKLQHDMEINVKTDKWVQFLKFRNCISLI